MTTQLEETMTDNLKQKECVVAFLDILGFSNLVEEANTDSAKLRNLIDAMKAVNVIPTGSKKVTNSNGEERTIDIRTRFFSDSLVFYTNKESENISQLFFLIRFVQDQLWESGYCLRGGISIDNMYWPENDDNITVGQGMIKSYRLENEVAIYPRVIVSRELKSYIKEQTIKGYPFVCSKTELLKNYIKKDADGEYFLDLLNKNITRAKDEKLEVSEDNKSFSVVFSDIMNGRHSEVLNNVNSIIETHINNGEDKIRQKYGWLKTYMESNNG
jgi:hypothetical protein